MISWPERALDALAFLWRPYNDIDVFVEDVRAKSVYEILINRALEDKAKIGSVIPLKGKSRVLKKCAADQGAGGRPRVYIIDGDFDVLLGIEKPELKRLYRIDAYCIENLLFSEHAAIEIIYEDDGQKSKNSIKNRMKFATWSKSICSKMAPLILVYAAVSGIRIPLKTVDFSSLALVGGAGSKRDVCRPKIKRRIREITAAAERACGYKFVRSEADKLKAILPNNFEETLKRIPGKTTLIPLLHFRMCRLFGFSGSSSRIKGRLARHCSLDIDPGFKAAFTKVAKGDVWL